MTFLKNFEGPAYAALRAVAGFMFLWHGTMKYFGFPKKFAHGHLDFMVTAAGAIEMVAGTLILIGLFTRFSAFVASGTMAVAYWVYHFAKAPKPGVSGDNWFFPIVNGGELAALYCFVFLYIACRGGGVFSIDSLRR